MTYAYSIWKDLPKADGYAETEHDLFVSGNQAAIGMRQLLKVACSR